MGAHHMGSIKSDLSLEPYSEGLPIRATRLNHVDWRVTISKRRETNIPP